MEKFNNNLFCKIIKVEKKSIFYRSLNLSDTTLHEIDKSDVLDYKFNCIQEYNSFLNLQQRFLNKIDSNRLDEILIKKRKYYYVVNIIAIENDSIYYRKYKEKVIIGIPLKSIVELRYDLKNKESKYYFVDTLDYPLYDFRHNKSGMYKYLYDNWPIDSILYKYKVSNYTSISDKHLFVSKNSGKRNFKLYRKRKMIYILRNDFTKLKLYNKIKDVTDTSLVITYKDIFYDIPFNQIEVIGLESKGRIILRIGLFIPTIPFAYGTYVFFLTRRWYKPLELDTKWKISSTKNNYR